MPAPVLVNQTLPPSLSSWSVPQESLYFQRLIFKFNSEDRAHLLSGSCVQHFLHLLEWLQQRDDAHIRPERIAHLEYRLTSRKEIPTLHIHTSQLKLHRSWEVVN